MVLTKFTISSESVTDGHPDKICDQISDAILDKIFEQDPNSRTAIETMATTNHIFIMGEVTTTAEFNAVEIAKKTIRDIGYTKPEYDFSDKTVKIDTFIHTQSPDIAQGVDIKDGAGDQGMMFGYATNETKELMPMPITYAHKLTEKLSEVRKKGILSYLRPDGKAQVSVEYEKGVPKRLSTVVVAASHDENVSEDIVKKDSMEHVIQPVCGKLIDSLTKIHINGTGKFVMCGLAADSGLTGRKIIVDTYGGIGSHGGGCFSGKDPSKVDRSASYMARYIAKNLVAAEVCDACEVQLAYCIGIADPVSIYISARNAKIPEERIIEIIKTIFPLTPKGIIEHLKLRRPIYQKTASFGHFGRNLEEFTWEKIDMVDKIKEEVEKDKKFSFKISFK